MYYSKNQKCCATCAYWSGDRTINSFRDRVDTKNSMSYKCIGGGFNNVHRSASSLCSKYLKLPQLK